MADDLSQFIVKAKKGDLLFKEGETGDTMFFIHSGKVRIEKSMDGKPELLAVLEKGDFFGEMAVLDHIPRAASAIVDENAELLKVDSANFEKLLKANIEIAVRMIRKYAGRLRETNSKLEALLRDRKEFSDGIADIIDSVKKKPTPVTDTHPEIPYGELVGSKSVGSFPLLKSPCTIGRADPAANINPEVDLTEADTKRSVSRRHAQIQHIDGEFFLIEEVGVSNGTFVNEEKIRAGAPMKIENGTKVRFGNVGFTFKSKR